MIKIVESDKDESYRKYDINQKIHISNNEILIKKPNLFKNNFVRTMDYLDDELLILLRQYYDEYGKVPSQIDIRNNKKYPSVATFQNHFGSWSNALSLAGIDVDTLIKNGKLQNSYHKGRLAELIVFNSFKDKNKAVDLSGINCNSIFDGLCPRGKSYDVKSASLIYSKKYIDSGGWGFHVRNKERKNIEYFYLVALDENFENLCYVWLIPLELIEDVRDTLYISIAKIHNYDKYLIDFEKCNLDFLNINLEKGEV